MLTLLLRRNNLKYAASQLPPGFLSANCLNSPFQFRWGDSATFRQDTTAGFDQHYQTHLKHLKLKGLQPKTIDAYSRTIRRMSDYFDHRTCNLSPAQLTDYFIGLVSTLSWSAVKLDRYGFKFYTQHVMGKPSGGMTS